jgi:hypothetical protein
MKIALIAAFVLLTHYGYSQDRILVLTSGGGVTGVATVYQISRDGNVLKGKGRGEVNYSEQGKIKKCRARKFYRAAHKLTESSSGFNHPGNIYYSIATKENGEQMKMTWGDPQNPVRDDAKKLFTRITDAISKVNFTPR